MKTTKKKVENMKTCRRCREDKPLDDFYRDKMSRDARGSYCKKCSHKTSGESKKRRGFYHSEAYRTFRRLSGFNTFSYRKQMLIRYASNKANHIKARIAVKDALENGTLERKPCKICKEDKVHAHHHAGYDPKEWLNITWLCNEHHRQAHHGK